MELSTTSRWQKLPFLEVLIWAYQANGSFQPEKRIKPTISKSSKSQIIHHFVKVSAKRHASNADKRIQFWITSLSPPSTDIGTSDFLTVSSAFLFIFTLHSINDAPPNKPPTSTSFQFLIRRFEDLSKSSSIESSMVVIIDKLLPFQIFHVFKDPSVCQFPFLFTQVISQVIRWTALHQGWNGIICCIWVCHSGLLQWKTFRSKLKFYLNFC